VQKERSTEKKQPSPLRSGREVACRFRQASTIFRKLGPNVAKERAKMSLLLENIRVEAESAISKHSKLWPQYRILTE
jgi:hypothetical protein